MVGVDALDVRAHGSDPRSDSGLGASARRGTSASGAAGFVGKFPSKDTGLVLIASNEGVDVVLERGDNLGVAVEVVMVGRTEDLLDVDVHATVVGPVVGEWNDQAETVPMGVRDALARGFRKNAKEARRTTWRKRRSGRTWSKQRFGWSG